MANSDPRATRPSLLLCVRDPSNSAAWIEFAGIYGPVIRGYCRRRGLQDADAADVGQEVLAQVARSIESFEYEPGRGRFRDWLGTVTRNKITRFLEARGRADLTAGGEIDPQRYASAGDDPEWSAEFHERILVTSLLRIRDDFEPTTWEAFVRVWVDDRPSPEVAKAMGMTIGAVYAAKSRVLRRLREEVLALADDLPGALATP